MTQHAPARHRHPEPPVRCRRRLLAGWRARVTRRLLILTISAAVVSGAGGVAFAYFTATGHGTGSASTGTMQTVTIASATGTPSTPLLPGGTGDVVLKVTNPNSYAVTLVSVASSGTITAGNGCTPTGVSFTNQTGLTTSLAANSTTQVDLAGAASMSTASAANCQGTIFAIPVTITVQK